jgi:maleylacetate reductase
MIPVIAIPTTYAGSEMTPVVGITHTRETPPRKVTVNDPRIAPKLVIYDPLLTIDLPPEMTASTGSMGWRMRGSGLLHSTQPRLDCGRT